MSRRKSAVSSAAAPEPAGVPEQEAEPQPSPREVPEELPRNDKGRFLRWAKLNIDGSFFFQDASDSPEGAFAVAAGAAGLSGQWVHGHTMEEAIDAWLYHYENGGLDAGGDGIQGSAAPRRVSPSPSGSYVVQAQSGEWVHGETLEEAVTAAGYRFKETDNG